MLFITQNTETQLLKDLKEYWKTRPTYRCLHLQLNKDIFETDNAFNYISEAIEHHLDDKSARIYKCRDNDIFLLTRYITHKTANELLEKTCTTLEINTPDQKADLYEIGVEFSALKNICIEKIRRIEQLKQEKIAKEKELIELKKQQRENTFGKISDALIRSLSKRREERENTEIMIVEDDLFTQKLVKNAIKDKYVLSMSNDGVNAIINYINKAPDVLFLDIGLPDIDGHEVLEKLFKLDPSAYVVMFSGNGDKDNITKAIELGAKGFIGKPFTQEKLLHYIEKSPFIQKKQNKETIHGNLVH